jgi:hypothetical protein
VNWFKRIHRAKEPIRAQDKGALEDELRDWQIVTGENKEQQSRATIRLRVRKPPMPDGRAFDCAVEISWPYAGMDYPYPIQINFYRDPGWQIWSDAVEAVQSKGA